MNPLVMFLLLSATVEAKNCKDGQPCGNSCISWSKTCHKGRSTTHTTTPPAQEKPENTPQPEHVKSLSNSSQTTPQTQAVKAKKKLNHPQPAADVAVSALFVAVATSALFVAMFIGLYARSRKREKKERIERERQERMMRERDASEAPDMARIWLLKYVAMADRRFADGEELGIIQTIQTYFPPDRQSAIKAKIADLKPETSALPGVLAVLLTLPRSQRQAIYADLERLSTADGKATRAEKERLLVIREGLHLD